MLAMFWYVACGVALAVIVAGRSTSVRIGDARVKLRPLTLDGFIYNEIVNQDDYGLRQTPLPPSPVILDIGAQAGIFTAFAAAVYPDARIYAYEMDDLNFAALSENTAAIRGRATPVRAMLVGDDVPTGYTRDALNSGGHRVGGSLPAPRAVTLGGALAENGLDRVDLLKIDIEGSEYDVLGRAASDGSIARIDRIHGEWHGGRVAEIVAMLSPLFVVRTTVSSDPSVGLFFAGRRGLTRP